MIVSRVTYLLRRTLGNYQHEEMMAEVSYDPQNPAPGDQLMEMAKAVCLHAVTKAAAPEAKAQTSNARPAQSAQTATRQTSATMTPNRARAASGGPRNRRKPTIEQMASMPYAIACPGIFGNTRNGTPKDQAKLDMLNSMGFEYSSAKDGGDGLWHGPVYPTGVDGDLVQFPEGDTDAGDGILDDDLPKSYE